MLYENEKPVKVTSVVISTQHSKDLNQEKVRDAVIPYIKKSIPKNFLLDLNPKEIYINLLVNLSSVDPMVIQV